MYRNYSVLLLYIFWMTLLGFSLAAADAPRDKNLRVLTRFPSLEEIKVHLNEEKKEIQLPWYTFTLETELLNRSSAASSNPIAEVQLLRYYFTGLLNWASAATPNPIVKIELLEIIKADSTCIQGYAETDKFVITKNNPYRSHGSHTGQHEQHEDMHELDLKAKVTFADHSQIFSQIRIHIKLIRAERPGIKDDFVEAFIESPKDCIDTKDIIIRSKMLVGEDLGPIFTGPRSAIEERIRQDKLYEVEVWWLLRESETLPGIFVLDFKDSASKRGPKRFKYNSDGSWELLKNTMTPQEKLPCEKVYAKDAHRINLEDLYTIIFKKLDLDYKKQITPESIAHPLTE